MTVAELLGRISSRELSEWMVFFESRPSTALRSAQDAKRQKTPQEIYALMRTWASLNG